MDSVAYGRHFGSVARKIRNAVSRTSPTVCGRKGGYRLFVIRAYYRSEAKVRMTMNLTVATLLAEGVRRLRSCPAGTAPGATPEPDAQVLLAHVLGVPRVRLRSHPEEPPGAQAALRYRALLERRAAGEPVAYLTGEKDF